MKYNEIKPQKELSHWVQCYWEYENEKEWEHCILPDGYFDWLINYDEAGNIINMQLTGIATQPVTVKLPSRTRILAIRFRLLAAEYVFQQNIKSILDTPTSLPNDFWEINAAGYMSLESLAKKLDCLILKILEKKPKIDNRKIHLFQLIYEDKIFNVETIAQKIFWSPRQINRYFSQKFGFPLKLFLNIVRCNDTYKNIANNDYNAIEHYFDQPHFIKEIKKYTQNTPKQLTKNQNDRFLQLSTRQLK